MHNTGLLRYVTVLACVQVINLSPTIVFIFGGPGTQKGKYIDYLTDIYGFHCISICKVLEEELGETQVYDMRTSEMMNITIGTVMDWFVRRIEMKRKTPGFIIDIIPNIKVIISFQSSTNSIAPRKMCKFEELSYGKSIGLMQKFYKTCTKSVTGELSKSVANLNMNI